MVSPLPIIPFLLLVLLVIHQYSWLGTPRNRHLTLPAPLLPAPRPAQSPGARTRWRHKPTGGFWEPGGSTLRHQVQVEGPDAVSGITSKLPAAALQAGEAAPGAACPHLAPSLQIHGLHPTYAWLWERRPSGPPPKEPRGRAKAGARAPGTAEVLWVPRFKSTTLPELSQLETFSIGNVGGGTTKPMAVVEIWDLPSQPGRLRPVATLSQLLPPISGTAGGHHTGFPPAHLFASSAWQPSSCGIGGRAPKNARKPQWGIHSSDLLQERIPCLLQRDHPVLAPSRDGDERKASTH